MSEPAMLARVAPLADRAAALVERLAAVGTDEWLQSALAQHAAALREEAAAGDPVAMDDRAVLLATAMHLSPFEYDVLLLAGLPEEHEALAHLARGLPPTGEPYLTMAAIVGVLEL